MRKRTTPKFNYWAIVTVLAFGLVACGGMAVVDTTAVPTTTAPTTTQAPSTTQATTTTVAPTTTTQAVTATTADAVEEAAAHYLEIVAPSNCSIGTIVAAETALSGSDGFFEADWEQIQVELLPLYLAHADEELKFMDALAAYDWPGIVAVDVQTLTGELTVLVDYWQGLAASSSFDAWAGYADNTTYDAPGQIRAKLGLPAIVGVGPAC